VLEPHLSERRRQLSGEETHRGPRLAAHGETTKGEDPLDDRQPYTRSLLIPGDPCGIAESLDDGRVTGDRIHVDEQVDDALKPFSLSVAKERGGNTRDGVKQGG